MPAFFDRAYSLNIEGRVITGLDLEFSVKHTLGDTANEATFTVYNLAPDSRKVLSETPDPTVDFSAGYAGNLSRLYLGNVSKIASGREGVDWRTVIEAGDGIKNMRASRVSMSFPAGSKLETVAKELVAKTGLKIGDLADKLKEKGAKAAFTEFFSGVSFSGNAHDEVVALGKSLGLRVSVQDGAYRAVGAKDGTTQTEAFVLSPTSGLLGSPEIGDKGTVTAKSLLLPSVRPGDRVKVVSDAVEGFFRIQVGTHSGGYRSPDWTTTLELKPV